MMMTISQAVSSVRLIRSTRGEVCLDSAEDESAEDGIFEDE
jgi:hypothetical protein